MEDRLHMNFLRRHQRESLGEIESHLITEDTLGARTGSVVLLGTVFHHVTEEIEVRFHRFSVLHGRRAWGEENSENHAEFSRGNRSENRRTSFKNKRKIAMKQGSRDYAEGRREEGPESRMVMTITVRLKNCRHALLFL